MKNLNKLEQELCDHLESKMFNLRAIMQRIKNSGYTCKVVSGYDSCYWEMWDTKVPGVIGERDVCIGRGNIP